MKSHLTVCQLLQSAHTPVQTLRSSVWNDTIEKLGGRQQNGKYYSIFVSWRNIHLKHPTFPEYLSSLPLALRDHVLPLSSPDSTLPLIPNPCRRFCTCSMAEMNLFLTSSLCACWSLSCSSETSTPDSRWNLALISSHIKRSSLTLSIARPVGR